MKAIHLIGNAHLDVAWLWQWQEGFAEIKATFRSALDRMKEFDDFKFTSACSCYYMWIEKSDKKMFKEIQDKVKEGRWNIVGGWFLQPDCNIPSGESFARHALYSQRYFKEKFGVTAKTGYNVDSFGHNGNIPKILRNSGMENYLYMRPMKHEKELPEYLFDWQSMDGSKVRTYRIPEYYNIDLSRTDVFGRIGELAEAHDMMAFYGVGNHGGGATVALLDEMHRTLSGEYIYSTVDEYFDAVKDLGLRTVEDDLQFHAKGCYSAMSEIKQNNRKAESMLCNTEFYSVLSEKIINTEYPKHELDKAWGNILFNQFHDILGGCCIREAYDDARMFHNEAMAIAARNTNFALQQISWNIDTMDGKDLEVYKPSAPPVPWRSKENIGTPVVIFNPNSFEVTDTVKVRDLAKYVTDDKRNIIPFQIIRDSKTDFENKYCTAFTATIPAMGYTVYRLYFEGDKEPPKTDVKAYQNVLENSRIKVEFDTQTGEISKITDNTTGYILASGNGQTILMDETHCDTWAHDIEEFKNVFAVCDKGTVKVIENGSARATIRTEQFFENSHIIRDYSLIPNSDEIFVRAFIDYHEKHKMLKFSLPVNINDPKAFCEIPYGFIERSTDGKEHVSQSWIALKGQDQGLGIATNSNYSFDADANVLSLTVLRGAIFADHFGRRDEFCEYMDQGEHKFEYTIFPYSTPSNATKRAQKLNNKLVAIEETFHKGGLETRFSGIKIDKENIIVTALKKSEDSCGFVLRCYEADNIDTRATITVFGTEITTEFKHNQVKTFVIDGKNVSEVNFIEW